MVKQAFGVAQGTKRTKFRQSSFGSHFRQSKFASRQQGERIHEIDRRLRQQLSLHSGRRKPCRIAQDEIRAGKVKWEIPETRSAAEQAAEVLDKAFGDA
jgi:hypothetical protein